MGQITIHLNGLAPDLLPIRAHRIRPWWQEDPKTQGHAHHCLPLLMANSVGWYIRSPGRFAATWSGDPDEDAEIDLLGDGAGYTVDAHSARGSFTVQPGFIPTTESPGDFVWIKGIANQRTPPFTVMEALIEAWWQPGEFGLVCLLNRPGRVVVERGEPIAQMTVFRAEGGFTDLRVTEELPAETEAWRQRRYRPEFRKDLDYLRGRHPDGTPEPTHIRNWTAGAPT